MFVLRDRVLDRIEVRVPEAVELTQLLRPAALTVRLAVGQARVDEPAVAPRGRPADRARLDEDDAALRIPFLRTDRGPQPRVAAADDREIGIHRPFEPSRPLRPERPRARTRALRVSRSESRMTDSSGGRRSNTVWCMAHSLAASSQFHAGDSSFLRPC